MRRGGGWPKHLNHKFWESHADIECRCAVGGEVLLKVASFLVNSVDPMNKNNHNPTPTPPFTLFPHPSPLPPPSSFSVEILDDMLMGVGSSMELYLEQLRSGYIPPLANGHRLYVYDHRGIAVRMGVCMGEEGDAVVSRGWGDGGMGLSVCL